MINALRSRWRDFSHLTFKCAMSFNSVNTVSVRSFPNEDHLTLNFTWEGKLRQMKRGKDESLGKALQRVAISLSAPNKKAKRRKNEETESGNKNSLCVNLYDKESIVSETLSNELAWIEGHILKINEHNLFVTRNPPNVLTLKLPNSIMSGFPVFPVADLEFADICHSTFTWYSQRKAESQGEESGWIEVGRTFKYTPTMEDMNCHLKVTCLPGNTERRGFSTSSAVSVNPVSAGPGLSPFDERHLYTSKQLSGERIRIVSYNILAELYSKEEFALNVLYPYCPHYALDISYRQHLIVKEILGYNADIICLQECGKKMFDNFLKPTFAGQGYDGCFKSKVGEIPEGEATFFRKDRFKIVMTHDIELSPSLHKDAWQKNIASLFADCSQIPGKCV